MASFPHARMTSRPPLICRRLYRKALAQFHPDKAARRGETWQRVLESEEVYKLVQKLHDKYTSGASLPSHGTAEAIRHSRARRSTRRSTWPCRSQRPEPEPEPEAAQPSVLCTTRAHAIQHNTSGTLAPGQRGGARALRAPCALAVCGERPA